MIETKQITSDKRYLIEQYKAFGWEETGETPAASRKEKSLINLARDTDMKHYKEVKVFEGTFESHLDRIQDDPEIDYFICILLFVLGIIPGVIYLYALKAKKARVEKENAEQENYLKQMCIQAKKARGL